MKLLNNFILYIAAQASHNTPDPPQLFCHTLLSFLITVNYKANHLFAILSFHETWY